MASFSDPTQLPSWKKLQDYHASQGHRLYIPELFMNNPNRFNDYSVTISNDAVHLIVDYSKNLVDDVTKGHLIELAKETNLEAERDRLFEGEKINATEDRSVLHVALRAPLSAPFIVKDGSNVMSLIEQELMKMKCFAEAIHTGTWLGYSRAPITDIVNIGIGGSDLGPRMACQALLPYAQSCRLTQAPLRMHFVSNIDGADLEQALTVCSPESTLFIIVSKTFTTLETMTNAHSARTWFLNHAKDESAISKHFVAVSTNEAAVVAFGIPNDDEHVFKFWDWVGGRYSLWSVVGLSICLYIGFAQFCQLLDGAHAMDVHFRTAPIGQNAPMILALLGVWYNNFWGCQTIAVLPYEQNLALFPKYLQQADMESNGKSVARSNVPVHWSTGPIVWGEPGTNGQHAFYQLIHQGTKMIPADFIVGLRPTLGPGSGKALIEREAHHQILAANCFAQTEALMNGNCFDPNLAPETHYKKKPEENANPHRSFAGNKPTNTIVYDRLTPANLGALIALYEHKIFCQGAIWNIYSFDQWGVELGKKLALAVEQELKAGHVRDHHDPSTRALMDLYIQFKRKT